MNNVSNLLNLLPENLKTITFEFGKNIATELTLIGLKKIIEFIKNLIKKPKTNLELELFEEALHYVQISPQELSSIYARILNDYSSNKNKDLYSKYFKILSNLTLSDLYLLEKIYNGDNHSICIKKSEIDFITSFGIKTLQFNLLVSMNATLEDIWRGIASDSNLKDYTSITLTEIGISFYEACNNLNET